ncbi:unnamed protein product, partial [Allacma fusca]
MPEVIYPEISSILKACYHRWFSDRHKRRLAKAAASTEFGSSTLLVGHSEDSLSDNIEVDVLNGR